MSNDLISRKWVMEEISGIFISITGLRAGKGVLTLRTMSRKAKKQFTKEELKIYKKNSKKAYAWYI